MPRGGIVGTGTFGFGEPDGFVCSDEEKITFLDGPEIKLTAEKCLFCIDKNSQVCNAFRNSGLTIVKPATTMKKIALLTACSAALAATLNAQTPTTVTTDPVGFVSVTVPANSDAVLAVPLNRTSEYKGTVASIVGNTITVNGTPGWTANQFVFNGTTQLKNYAVQLASGAKEGMIAKVTANTTNSITVQLSSGDDLSGVVTGGSGDQLDIMPYWTPSSLFGNSLPAGTTLIGFTSAGAGINLGATDLYGATGSGWEDGNTGDPANDVGLPFGSAFVLRNVSGSPLSLSMVGSVPMNAHRMRLSTLAGNTPQDIYFGYASPVPEAVSSLGFPAVAGDQIIGFDNSATGINKGATIVYGYTGSGWEDSNTGDPLDSTVKLQPGFGYIFRRVASGSPSSVVWTHVQSYLQ